MRYTRISEDRKRQSVSLDRTTYMLLRTPSASFTHPRVTAIGPSNEDIASRDINGKQVLVEESFARTKMVMEDRAIGLNEKERERKKKKPNERNSRLHGVDVYKPMMVDAVLGYVSFQ